MLRLVGMETTQRTGPAGRFLTNDQADQVNWLAAKLDRTRRVEDSNVEHLSRIVAELATRLTTTDDLDRIDGILYHLRDAVSERHEANGQLEAVRTGPAGECAECGQHGPVEWTQDPFDLELAPPDESVPYQFMCDPCIGRRAESI